MLLPEERRGDGPLKVSTSQTRIVFKDLREGVRQWKRRKRIGRDRGS
jgi:hypothetical protein